AVAEILAFYGSNALNGFNMPFMTIVLLVFFAAVGTHTLRALCRLNELLIPLIVACLTILAVIVILTGFDLANIFPSLQNPAGFKDGIARHAAWIGDFTPLVLFMGRTKLKKSTGAFAAGAGVIGTAVAVFFTMIMSAAFGNVPMFADSTTNLSNILQFSIGNVYGRIDMLSSMLWSISVFIEAALFFYATCRCVAFVIGKNAHFQIALVVCVLVYITQIFALADRTIFTLAVTSIPTSVITLAFTVAVPALALVCALISRRKHGVSESEK
ncbi:MAG: GerAB/ArcD/ProY family transporter, partial [Clostridiales bacterium]|nr:GerAB/ArcD/ProY family transporter [Clostridiales bacterium]